MITDSPYRSGALVLSPLAGAAAGTVAAGAMLALIALLRPLSGIALVDALTRVGGGIARDVQTPAMLQAAGMAVVLALGAVCGLLYALTQQRIPLRGLIAVGVFYGVLLWAVGSLIVGRLFGGDMARLVRSWPWLLADLVYGLGLAAAAIWADRRRPPDQQPVLAD